MKREAYHERRHLKNDAHYFKTKPYLLYYAIENQRMRGRPHRQYDIKEAWLRMKSPEPPKFTASMKDVVQVINELDRQGEKDQVNKLIKQFL